MMKIEIMGEHLFMETMPGLFSPRQADRGTLAMLSTVTFQPGQRVLDLGCGWGLVGVLAARKCGAENVVMCDIDPAAVACAKRNAAVNGVEDVTVCLSDGLSGVAETGFDMILSNPPYQSDFSVAKRFLNKGFNRLKIGGSMLMVTKRLDWYKNRMTAIFGGVHVQQIDGYYVFCAQRRGWQYANAPERKNR